MKVSPQQFASLLKNSSLRKEDQKAVIELIPHLSIEQIDQIAELLEADNKEVEEILLKLDSDKKKALVQLEVDLDRIKIRKTE